MLSYKYMLGYSLADICLAQASKLQQDIVPISLERLKNTLKKADHWYFGTASVKWYMYLLMMHNSVHYLFGPLYMIVIVLTVRTESPDTTFSEEI